MKSFANTTQMTSRELVTCYVSLTLTVWLLRPLPHSPLPARCLWPHRKLVVYFISHMGYIMRRQNCHLLSLHVKRIFSGVLSGVFNDAVARTI
jgi:hypothetical protein